MSLLPAFASYPVVAHHVRFAKLLCLLTRRRSVPTPWHSTSLLSTGDAGQICQQIALLEEEGLRRDIDDRSGRRFVESCEMTSQLNIREHLIET
jgi:hypothetical protein